MMAVVDTFNALGFTQFSFEQYLGSLFMVPYPHQRWTLGLLLNWVVGGAFGTFYAWCFEFQTHRASARIGARIGLIHAVIAAAVLFPFLNIIHGFVGTELYSNFGFFGSGLGSATVVILLVAHVMYGATVGLFYGPVRVARVRYREFEPGDQGFPGEPGVITEEEDATDRWAG